MLQDVFDVLTVRPVSQIPSCRKPTFVRFIEASRRPTATNPNVDTPNPHVLSIPQQTKFFLRVCTKQPAVLVCSKKCYFLHRLPETTYCLCMNHPENNTIKSHFCQRFNVIRTFAVRFNVVRWMEMRSQSAKLFPLPIKIQNSSSLRLLKSQRDPAKIPVHERALQAHRCVNQRDEFL